MNILSIAILMARLGGPIKCKPYYIGPKGSHNFKAPEPVERNNELKERIKRNKRKKYNRRNKRGY